MVELCNSIAEISEIVISINPTASSGAICEKLALNSKVQIYEHEIDIGLYGNFKFLVAKANQQYFQWFCTDDQITLNHGSILNSMKIANADLSIPSWSWQEWNPEKERFFGDLKEGTYPRLESEKFLIESAINAEPSWIFGVWRTQFLKENFPSDYFDWLDVFLLQKVLLCGKVIKIGVESPTIIGTWNWANKLSHSVELTGPFARRFLLKFGILLFPFCLKHPTCFRTYLNRILWTIKFSKTERTKRKIDHTR